jgi:drug/metabolite transporter (DMT)-like permease
LKFVAIVALLWFGVIIVGRLGHRARERNPFPRSVLSIVLLSVVLGVAGTLFVRFALRSGNVALMLVALMMTPTLAVALGWYVTRATRTDRKRHHRPPRG